MSSHELLILLDYVCLLVMAVCTVITCLHTESYMQKLASYTCMIITLCSFWFLFKAEATSLETLVIGQRIIYCLTTHAMFAMFLFIAAYCGYSFPQFVSYICIGLNMAVSAMALTVPYNQLFYKKLWAAEVGGHLVLQKEYAFGHTIAVVLIALYAMATLALAIKFTIDNREKKKSYVWYLIVVVFVPIIAYIIPKLTGTDNDMQPLAFTVFLVLVVIMIYRNNLYDVDNILARYSVASIKDAVVVIDRNCRYKGCNKIADSIIPELKTLRMDEDIREKIDWFADILNGQTKDYEKDGEYYSVTVRNIDSKGKLQGSAIWFDNVTLLRNYTDLLKKQKDALQSAVVTLSDFSYKDELTGLSNRRKYEEVLETVRANGGTKHILVGVFDVNGLKHINDTIGHSAGDELIKGAGGILYETFSDDGVIFRIGGDEFFIIIRNPRKTVEEYEHELEDRMNMWKGDKIDNISIAYGLTLGEDYPDKSIDELSIIADRIMYEHKNEFYEVSRR